MLLTCPQWKWPYDNKVILATKATEKAISKLPDNAPIQTLVAQSDSQAERHSKLLPRAITPNGHNLGKSGLITMYNMNTISLDTTYTIYSGWVPHESNITPPPNEIKRAY